jgi:hypothetical protein
MHVAVHVTQPSKRVPCTQEAATAKLQGAVDALQATVEQQGAGAQVCVALPCMLARTSRRRVLV